MKADKQNNTRQTGETKQVGGSLREDLKQIFTDIHLWDGYGEHLTGQILSLLKQKLEEVVGEEVSYGKSCGDECGRTKEECVEIIDSSAEGYNSCRDKIKKAIEDLLK